MLTPVVRPALDGLAQLCLIDAPAPGTGKTLLADVVAIVATGTTAEIQSLPDSDAEIDKVLVSTLLEGQPVAVFDNLDRQLRSKHLAAMLTAGTYKGRYLGDRATSRSTTGRRGW